MLGACVSFVGVYGSVCARVVEQHMRIYFKSAVCVCVCMCDCVFLCFVRSRAVEL